MVYECGYMMTAFDQNRPRCRQFPREKSCPQCGTANPHKEEAYRRCRHLLSASHLLLLQQLQPNRRRYHCRQASRKKTIARELHYA